MTPASSFISRYNHRHHAPVSSYPASTRTEWIGTLLPLIKTPTRGRQYPLPIDPLARNGIMHSAEFGGHHNRVRIAFIGVKFMVQFIAQHRYIQTRSLGEMQATKTHSGFCSYGEEMLLGGWRRVGCGVENTTCHDPTEISSHHQNSNMLRQILYYTRNIRDQKVMTSCVQCPDRFKGRPFPVHLW